MLGTQEQLSLSANKAHKFLCTVIWTVKFYAWTIYLPVDSFKVDRTFGLIRNPLAK